MKLSLAYGKEGLPVELPDGLPVSVVEPAHRPALTAARAALREALRHPISAKPIRELARGARRVGIIFNDITRATPNDLIIEELIAELALSSGAEIVLFNATGTHRANTESELEAMLGPAVFGHFPIVQNDARLEGHHTSVGRSRGGNDIRLHRELLDCDLKILTGFIEPHFFAGFSGGAKAVMPGMAALSTIIHNHSPAHMDHPKATWGITDGNPVFMELQEAVGMIEGCFLLNVALNREKEITAVFAGDINEAHRRGCDYVRKASMVAVPHDFDVVITSNSGYPLDLNLYQSVKGMSAAAGVVKQGGTIIVAAECWDGIPDHGEFGKLLSEADSPASLLRSIRSSGFHRQDMWQAQIHAKVCEKAQVYLHSSFLTDEQVRGAFLRPCPSIEAQLEALRNERRRDLSVCVLPEGPVTIPYFS